MKTLSEALTASNCSLGQLVSRLQLSTQQVSNWKVRGIPVAFVIPVSKGLDWKVSPHSLNPFIYPHPDDGLPDHLRSCNKVA